MSNLSEHLTRNQIDRYRGRTLSPAELIQTSDHLAACADCRSQIERAMSGENAFFTMRSAILGDACENLDDPHPSFEQIAAFVDGVLAAELSQNLRDHLTRCEQCALAVDDLQPFARSEESQPEVAFVPTSAAVRRSRRARWTEIISSFAQYQRLAYGSALIAILLIGGVWLAWRTAAPGQAPLPSAGADRAPASVSATPAAELRDGAHRLTLDERGNLAGLPDLPANYQQMIRDALAGKSLERSSILDELTRPPSALMGARQPQDQLNIIEPVGKVLSTDRPSFRWSPMPGASGYVVEIYDEAFNAVTTSDRLTGPSWTPKQPLQRGAAYSWQVKAFKDGQQFTSPRPPAPQAKFRVLERVKLDELARVKQTYGSHLILALLYTQAGLLDEAEEELRLLQANNPGSTVVSRLIASVEAMR